MVVGWNALGAAPTEIIIELSTVVR